MMTFMKEGKNFLRAKKLHPKTKSLLRTALPFSVSLLGSRISKWLRAKKFPAAPQSNLVGQQKKAGSLI